MKWIVEVDEDKDITQAKWISELVCCKDCIFKNARTIRGNVRCNLHAFWIPDTWYCASGERKTDDPED